MNSTKEKPLPSGKGNGLNVNQQTNNNMPNFGCQEVDVQDKALRSTLDDALRIIRDAYDFFVFYLDKQDDIQRDFGLISGKEQIFEEMDEILVSNGWL